MRHRYKSEKAISPPLGTSSCSVLEVTFSSENGPGKVRESNRAGGRKGFAPRKQNRHAVDQIISKLRKANADWPRNPVDLFILAKLEMENLRPSPPANPARWIRRLYLDLIGLPLSIEDVDQFLKDPLPQTYEKIVDHVLASQRFGEK